LIALLQAVKSHDTIIFGHINLVPLALLPGLGARRKILIAHGIELWEPVSFLQSRGLKTMQEVWAVSRFTAGKLESVHRVPAQKLRYFPNCLDPFLAAAPIPPVAHWNRHWRLDTGKRYILTLSRLSSGEKAKGYDEVITLLPRLAERFPDIGYLLAGKWDEAEYARIRQLADRYGVADRVLMPGFVKSENLPAIFSMAQVFAMPSSKEGFGIVYLEAAWWGCPVVACHAGGAPEALMQGALGRLVSPGNREELYAALEESLLAGRPGGDQQQSNRLLIDQQFGFEAFCTRIQNLLTQTNHSL
jgi:glycosyltransferase involved in cell wall biosynthesis